VLHSAIHKLFAPTISATIYADRRKIIQLLPTIYANSLIAAFLKILKTQMSVTSEYITATDGTSKNTAQHLTAFQCNAASGETTKGILIGTGTANPSMSDYSLQTPAINNIQHGAMGFTLNAPTPSVYQLILSRSFTNNTGAQLSIREVGLVVMHSSGLFLADRSLYSVDLQNGLSVTFTYTLSVTL